MAISSSRDCPNCGSNHRSKCFAIYEDGYYCFSCGANKRSERSFSLQKLSADNSMLELPKHTLSPASFSLNSLKYLRKYHVTDDLIRKHSIAEAEDGSLITPVIVSNQVVMFQRRWHEPRRILTHGKKHQFIAGDVGSDTIVIVEDFISCIRVAETVASYCMFGTSISYDNIKQIVSDYNSIVIWADGDEPGQRAALKIKGSIEKLTSQFIAKRSFSTIEKSVINITTTQDPKCYTNTEIKEILQQHGAIYAKTR